MILICYKRFCTNNAKNDFNHFGKKFRSNQDDEEIQQQIDDLDNEISQLQNQGNKINPSQGMDTVLDEIANLQQSLACENSN